MRQTALSIALVIAWCLLSVTSATATHARSYPCRLSVRAPFRGTQSHFVGMWVRGRVLCQRSVNASASLFIEGYARPPGAGNEGRLVRFEREKSSLQSTFVLCGQGVGPHTRVYAKMELTSGSFDTGRPLAAAVRSKRVNASCP